MPLFFIRKPMWHRTNWYENWAPVVGRILLAAPFAVGAVFKAPWTAGFAPQVAMTAAVGVPLAGTAVFLAFLLEVIIAVMLFFGYRARLAAAVAVPYVVLLTALFHHTFATPYDFGFFVDHLVLIGALLYVSVFGSGRWSVRG